MGRKAFQTLPVYKGAGAACPFGLAFEPNLVTDRNPAAGGILWSTDLSNPLHGRMNGLIADWRGAADPSLGDNRFYAYHGTYYRSDPLHRARETTGPGAEFAYGTGQTELFSYEKDANTSDLFEHFDVAAEKSSDYGAETSYPPLDNSHRLTEVKIHDALQRAVGSATGYGEAPFKLKPNGQYDFQASRYSYGQDRTTSQIGEALTRIELPNVFNPRMGSPASGFEVRSWTDQRALPTRARLPDAGLHEAVYDIVGNARFLRDGNAQSQNYFVCNTYDMNGRLIEKGVISGRRWDRDWLEPAALIAPTSLSSQLLARWSLDQASGNVVADDSGNGNEGRIRGTPVWVWDAPNGMAHSLAFPGGASASRVEIGRSLSIARMNGQFTIAAWVKPRSLTNDSTIVYGKDPFGITLGWGGSPTRFWLKYAARDIVLDAPFLDADLGRWVHLAACYDGTAWRFFKDGEFLESVGSDFGYSGDRDWLIGAPDNLPSLNAVVHDVRFYSRGLSPGEVRALYLDGLVRNAASFVYDVGNNGSRYLRQALVSHQFRSIPLGGQLDAGLLANWRLDEGPGHSEVLSNVGGRLLRGRQLGKLKWHASTPSGAGHAPVFGNDRQGTESEVTALLLEPIAGLSRMAQFSIALQVRLPRKRGAGNIVDCVEGDRGIILCTHRTHGLAFGRVIGATESFAPAAGMPKDRSWHLLVGTFNGSHWQLFVDGEAGEAAEDPLGVCGHDGPWRIGAQFEGSVAGVRFYDRVLSVAEMEQLRAWDSPALLDLAVTTESFDYDSQGHPITCSTHVSEYGEEAFVTRLHYDSIGQVVRIDYPSSEPAKGDPAGSHPKQSSHR